jgi:hypothetical protein
MSLRSQSRFKTLCKVRDDIGAEYEVQCRLLCYETVSVVGRSAGSYGGTQKASLARPNSKSGAPSGNSVDTQRIRCCLLQQ